MTDLLTSITQRLNFANTGFWGWLVFVVLAVWLGVRAFMDDGRLRRVLSLMIPLVPVVLACVEVGLDWDRATRSFSFNRPGYLGLLAVLPLVIWLSLRSLAGLGAARQSLAIALRCVILALIAAALAEMQFVKFSERLTVMFVVDYSRSIPPDREPRIREYLDRVIQKFKPTNDLAGVIYFAKTPRIEIPPLAYLEPREPEGEYDRDHSDPGAAIKLAQAAFPENTMKRIVVISDGNQNRGDALRQAVTAKANGISIDVLPITYRYDDEVMVEKMSMPSDPHKGETVNVNVILRASAPTRGTLRIFQEADNRSVPIIEKEVELVPGVNPFTVAQTLDEPNAYTFKAKFQPLPGQDKVAANNEASAFAYVKGSARVLVLEGTPGEHEALIAALRADNIEVVLLARDQLPDSLAELRPYDSVILANLPRECLSDRQMEMLVANTFNLGAGLIMIGGADSFGAGGYIDSPIEKAMPVDMQIKSAKIKPKGALMLVMHACEIPQGNYWEKVIAKKAVETLSSSDEAGCVQSQGTVSWVFRLQEVRNKTHLYARIDRMTPQDMMDFDSVLIAARNELRKSDASVKHVILVTDGDPAAPTPAVVASFVSSKITVTTVGVGVHGNAGMLQVTLQNLASRTGGRYHNVTNNKSLPQIFQQEARTVSRPLIFEKDQGWSPDIVYPTDPIAGLAGTLPPIKGFVMTQPKENELVQVAITSPLPGGMENPVLAHWQFGLGKAAAFTSDAGAKWATSWASWEGYRKFWAQLVRWSMRSVEGNNITVYTHAADGKIKVIADVLDKENQFVNFAQIQGAVLDPSMQRKPLTLSQVAPGRYEGVIDDAEAQGTYFVTMESRLPGESPSLLTAGVTIPYPAEYKELESNPGLLEQIASIAGGRVVREETALRFEPEDNPFRHDMPLPTAAQDLWHMLVLGGVVLFLTDVGVRRIALDLSRARPALAIAWAYARGRKIEVAASQYMDKLHSRKAEVARQLDQARSARRFEPTPDSSGSGAAIFDDTPSPVRPSGAATAPQLQVTPEAPKEEDTYTSRLLKAKQRVWDQRKP